MSSYEPESTIFWRGEGSSKPIWPEIRLENIGGADSDPRESAGS